MSNLAMNLLRRVFRSEPSYPKPVCVLCGKPIGPRQSWMADGNGYVHIACRHPQLRYESRDKRKPKSEAS